MGRGRNIPGVVGALLLLPPAAAAYEADPRAPGVGERAHEDRVADHIAADALEQPPDRSQRGSFEVSPPLFPTLFIAGEQKSATTSLTMLLLSSDDVRVSADPADAPLGYETHYLNKCGECTAAAYAHRWLRNDSSARRGIIADGDDGWGPLSAAVLRPRVGLSSRDLDERGSGRLKLLDPSPDTFSSARAAAVLRSIMPTSLQPRARFIVSLRAPADRMLSWYNHRRRNIYVQKDAGVHNIFCVMNNREPVLMSPGRVLDDGGFSPTFDEEAECELELWFRTPDARRRRLLPATSTIDNKFYGYSLIRGHYADSLRKWTRTGWSRSQILVVGFDELIRPGSDALERVRSFAGLAPYGLDRLPAENSAGGSSQHPNPTQHPMCCATAQQLDSHFAEPNQQLYARTA